jgi:primosomal replication protein N''
VVWIAERLAAQIAALRRETATWSLRSWDHASPTLSRWQRRRLQHQEYERRLLAMRDQRQRQLAQATSLDEQQRLGKLKPTAAGWRAADRRWTRLKTYWRG